MTKRQLIDEIVTINQSAEPGFLANFDDSDLDEYLRHLRLAQRPHLSGDACRYDRYFKNCPTVPASRSTVVTEVAAEVTAGVAAEATANDLSVVAAAGSAQTPDADNPADQLDWNVSDNAYFSESYEPAELSDDGR